MGLKFNYLSGTGSGDPGAGNARVQTGGTSIAFSATDADGNAVYEALKLWVEPFSAPKAYITLFQDATHFAVYRIFSQVTDAGTYIIFNFNTVFTSLSALPQTVYVGTDLAGTTVWGGIFGTLSDQADLAAALILLKDNLGATSLNADSRRLFANDGTTLSLDWSDPAALVVAAPTLDLTTNSVALKLSTPIVDISDVQAIDVSNRQLFGSDGTTIVIDWGGPSLAVSGIIGESDNSDALAGDIGEYIESKVAIGSATALTTATAKNVTSISLTQGDWDVEGIVSFSTSSATFSGLTAGTSATSATLPTDGTEGYSGTQGTLLSEKDGITLARKRIKTTGTTTIYLVAKATFSAGSVSAFGHISARRVR